MVDTGYNPPAAKLQRIAATEYQEVPDRGMVWGEVHDENAWSLGGVAGHAGIFSTLDDMAILSQTMLNGGWYGEARILAEESVTAMITNENEEFPGDAHGLGFELNQRWYMSGLTSIRTAGHTGFTGTSLVIDFNSASFVILLTNRVHPSREWGSINPARRSAADGMADAMSIEPDAHGRSSRTAPAAAPRPWAPCVVLRPRGGPAAPGDPGTAAPRHPASPDTQRGRPARVAQVSFAHTATSTGTV